MERRLLKEIQVLREVLKEKNTRKRKRRWSVRPLNANRLTSGEYMQLVRPMRSMDLEQHHRYFRMSPETFKFLLSKIENKISRNNTHKQPISADERLALTLRFLAHGGDQLTIAHSYHMSPASVSCIVREVCDALASYLFENYVKAPTTGEWVKIEQQFRDKCGFPNCIGSIDGKHCYIKGEKPPVTKNIDRERAIRRGEQWKWPNATIPYVIDITSGYNEFELEVIQMAMEQYHRYTCIKWVPRNNEKDYILITNNTGCWSFVGRQGTGMQELSLQKPTMSGTCIIPGIVQHQMMHAAGFWHEQSRADRDSYVTVHWNNIIQGKQHNFLKYNVELMANLGTMYDYGSLMHYGNLSFSVNSSVGGAYTILPKREEARTVVGQRRGFSATDVFKLNKFYGCTAVVNTRVCTFDENWCGWIQDYNIFLNGNSWNTNSTTSYGEYDDDFDWIRLFMTSTTSFTGPKQDHTSTKGKYIYAEASCPVMEGDQARIRSPWIQARGLTCITFWYNMYSTGKSADPMGALRVYTLEQGSGAGRKVRWARQGTQSIVNTQWLQGYFQVELFNKFQVIFEAVTGISYKSDIAIDDFFVYDGICGSVVPSLGNPYLCTFESGTCNYQQDKMDEFDWTYMDGPIGPISGSYSRDYGNNYMVAIASMNERTGDAARIYTPHLTLSSNMSICIHFHFWLVVTNQAMLNVYLEPIGNIQQLLYSRNQRTTFWGHHTLKSGVLDGPFVVTFEAVRGQGPERDLIGVDFIEIYNC